MTTELKPCPCGHTPEGLRIEGELKAKFAKVCGECCGEWTVEFRNDYYPLDSEQSWDRAAQAWNSAPRAEPQVEREPSEAIYPSESHAVPLADCRMCGASVDFVCRDGDWLARCPGCGLTLGEPHGYSSRLDLCRDWNRVVEREPSDDDYKQIYTLAKQFAFIDISDDTSYVVNGRAMWQAVREVMGGEVGR